MSLLTSTHKKQRKTTAAISTTLLLATLTLSGVSGCTTTQEFKPTASVLVGGHKSL